jgi:hypothetical protein
MNSDPLILPLAHAAAACYGAQPTWSAESHVYHSVVNGVDTFAFEGTADGADWLVNFTALPWPIHDHLTVGPVHLGWWRSVQSTLPQIVAFLEGKGWPPFYVCGHSKGAAEAILAHTALKLLGHAPLATRAYEPPKVGTVLLRDYLFRDDIRWTRTWNDYGLDTVCCVPEFPPWSHIDRVVDLAVSNTVDDVARHKMPVVLAALGS